MLYFIVNVFGWFTLGTVVCSFIRPKETYNVMETVLVLLTFTSLLVRSKVVMIRDHCRKTQQQPDKPRGPRKTLSRVGGASPPQSSPASETDEQ